MMTLEEFRETLGPLNDELTEEQILKLRTDMDTMAGIFYKMWREKIKKK